MVLEMLLSVASRSPDPPSQRAVVVAALLGSLSLAEILVCVLVLSGLRATAR